MIKFKHSLRSRIIFYFGLFGAILGSVYAVAIYISLDKVDDHLIDGHLQEEIDHFTLHYRKFTKYPGPISPQIHVFVGTEIIPPNFKAMIKGFDYGIHEINLKNNEYHIAIKKLPDSDKSLYLFFEVSDLEFMEKRKFTIGLVLITGVILITALGVWIGWIISRQVIAPVIHLSKAVRASGPENLPKNLSQSFYDDEVGLLAESLEHAMRRVDTFIARENRFCRYASHELRTPVAVIKGAVGLMRREIRQLENDRIERPMLRIERSLTNMENIIETLLLLSREDVVVESNESFDVTAVVKETIANNRYLIGNKPIDIEFRNEGSPRLALPPPLFQIAITNLIRNAIQHNTSGKIIVNVNEDSVTVSDNGRGMTPEQLALASQWYKNSDRQKNTGLGLTIVKRLCNRLGWKLVMASEKERGTVVRLVFRFHSP